ncbi:MAG TPA: hypothetical protein VI548_11180 [Chitinophagaceae bacterium]|nr:hypothetical protein [Chitinophagaceae bacterium]
MNFISIHLSYVTAGRTNRTTFVSRVMFGEVIQFNFFHSFSTYVITHHLLNII